MSGGAIMTKKSTRRDFLRGKAAGDAAGAAIDRLLPELGDESADRRTLIISRAAMAGRFEICVDATDSHAIEAAWDALELVGEYESRWSYFRSESEISAINAAAAEGPVPVRGDLFELLQRSRVLFQETGGAFDLTATPLWELWGFARREGRVPDDAALTEALRLVGMEHVDLDEAASAVSFRTPGVRLNLGAIGKGYVVDRCAERLAAGGVSSFLLSGGLSSMVAKGRSPGGASDGWTVGIRNPLRPDRRLARLVLRDRALATSGSYIQSFRFGGKRFGHIIDPRTGRPAEHMLSTTVLAPSAETADALSTAFYVMGVERAVEFCGNRPELGAVLIVPARTGGGWSIHRVGIADDQWLPEAE